nr:hypothetical protein [Angustibacter aerolatus]
MTTNQAPANPHDVPRLVLGPMLRHVDRTTATVWVETDRPCEVEVLGHRARTWGVHGHHYALVVVEGLRPGTTTPYEVHLDGATAWPEPGGVLPPSVVRTVGDDGAEPAARVRLVPAGCALRPLEPAVGRRRRARRAGPADERRRLGRGPDRRHHRLARPAAARRRPGVRRRPVPAAARAAAAARPGRRPSARGGRGRQRGGRGDRRLRGVRLALPRVVADAGGALAAVDRAVLHGARRPRPARRLEQARCRGERRSPASRGGRRGCAARWRRTGSTSTWATCPPTTSTTTRRTARCSAPGRTTSASACSPGWPTAPTPSRAPRAGAFHRDLGRTRLVVIDSRCSRSLQPGHRAMVDDREWKWVHEQATAPGVDHLLLGTSLPFLLLHGIHHLEGFDEAIAEGAWGRRGERVGEKPRLAVDLEHWAAFRNSFDAMVGLVQEVAAPDPDGGSPASVLWLSGDVHCSYLAEARVEGVDPDRTALHQAHHVAVPQPARALDPGREPAARAAQGGGRPRLAGAAGRRRRPADHLGRRPRPLVRQRRHDGGDEGARGLGRGRARARRRRRAGARPHPHPRAHPLSRPGSLGREEVTIGGVA